MPIGMRLLEAVGSELFFPGPTLPHLLVRVRAHLASSQETPPGVQGPELGEPSPLNDLGHDLSEPNPEASGALTL